MSLKNLSLTETIKVSLSLLFLSASAYIKLNSASLFPIWQKILKRQKMSKNANSEKTLFDWNLQSVYLFSASAYIKLYLTHNINETFLVDRICHFMPCSRQTLEINVSWKRDNVSIEIEKKILTLNLKMSWVKGFKCSLCKFHLPKKGKNRFAFCLHLIF